MHVRVQCSSGGKRPKSNAARDTIPKFKFCLDILRISTFQVFLSGGFYDVDGLTEVPNGDKIYKYVVNSHFREVATDTYC